VITSQKKEEENKVLVFSFLWRHRRKKSEVWDFICFYFMVLDKKNARSLPAEEERYMQKRKWSESWTLVLVLIHSAWRRGRSDTYSCLWGGRETDFLLNSKASQVDAMKIFSYLLIIIFSVATQEKEGQQEKKLEMKYKEVKTPKWNRQS